MLNFDHGALSPPPVLHTQQKQLSAPSQDLMPLAAQLLPPQVES